MWLAMFYGEWLSDLFNVLYFYFIFIVTLFIVLVTYLYRTYFIFLLLYRSYRGYGMPAKPHRCRLLVLPSRAWHYYRACRTAAPLYWPSVVYLYRAFVRCAARCAVRLTLTTVVAFCLVARGLPLALRAPLWLVRSGAARAYAYTIALYRCVYLHFTVPATRAFTCICAACHAHYWFCTHLTPHPFHHGWLIVNAVPGLFFIGAGYCLPGVRTFA